MSQTVRLLLVDDDEVDRERVIRALGKTELRALVTEATDPLSALAQLRRSPFDVVLLDYHFPRHDGMLLLRELQEDGSLVPVIMLTGQDESALAVELMKGGAVDYIPKGGLTPARLGTSIRHALRIGASDLAARAVQEALRSSESLNHVIQENTTDCIKVLDAEGRVLSISAEGRRTLEITDMEAYHYQAFRDLWFPEHRAAAQSAVDVARAGARAEFTGICPTATGKPLWWKVTMVPAPGPQGKPDRLVAISHVVPPPPPK